MKWRKESKSLIVDDDQKSVNCCRSTRNEPDLKRAAVEGGEMYRLLADNQPDLIILDIMMPEMTASACANRFVAAPRCRSSCWTAASDEADRVIGLELGADDYIAKPFSPRELMARIMTVASCRIPPAGTRKRPPYSFCRTGFSTP